MMQKALIREMTLTAQQMGKRLEVQQGRKGLRVATDSGCLRLVSNPKAEIHRRTIKGYYKILGLPPAP